MNKDNLLFATIGLLVGFITGYLLHEVMVARQPMRRPPGEAALVTPGPGGGDADPGAMGGATAAGPASAGAAGGSGVGGAGGSDSAGAAAPASAAGAAAGAGGATAAGGGGGMGAPGMAAVQQLRDYVAAHPKDADAVLKLANLNFDIQNWGRARELYTQYLSLRQPTADVLTDLGNSDRGLRDFDAALEQYHRAEALAPSHWKALFSEVVVLGFDLKRLDEAQKAMTRLQALAPQQPEVAQLAAALQQRRTAG